MVTPCTFVTVSPALAQLVAPPGEPASVHTPAGTAPDPRDPAASGLSCPEDAPTSRAVCAASAPPPTWPGLPLCEQRGDAALTHQRQEHHRLFHRDSGKDLFPVFDVSKQRQETKLQVYGNDAYWQKQHSKLRMEAHKNTQQ